MATIKFFLQSKAEIANIYLRFSLNRNTVLKRKTGFTINPKNWSDEKNIPIAKTDYLKTLKLQLGKLEIYIEQNYNIDINEGKVINGEWLQNKIDFFNNKKVAVDHEILTNYIQKYINEAAFRRNQKNELGLSERRVKSLITFKNKIIEFENDFFRGRKILIKDIGIEFTNSFVGWLNQKAYSTNYIGKNIDNLKCICLDAERNGMRVSYQLKSIKSCSETKSPDKIIYLSDSELNLIKQTKMPADYLDNARKWLLFGCQIGQRAGDLLSIKETDIKIGRKFKQIFEIKQKKTGKIVSIPLLPETKEIISTGFPRKISTTNFNLYIKQVCKLAGINDIVSGRIKEQSRGATKIVSAPKHSLISTHVCRRSFATNYYNSNIFPTPILMGITGHSTEKMFLKYIGRTSQDNARMMIELTQRLIQNN